MIDAQDIKVSIITPVHNDSKYVSQTIESILAQTHSNLELIIIDDYSTDNTLEKVGEFSDSRIRVFKNDKNEGAAFSRNLGIANATGDYIAFLDGDDLWGKDKIEKQLRFMIDNDCDFSCTDYHIIDEDGNDEKTIVSGPFRVTHKKFLSYSSAIGCLTSMYKKSAYPDLKIPNDIYKRNDYAMWLKISEKCDCFRLKEDLAGHRIRKKSLSSVSKIELFKYHKYLFKRLYGFGKLKAFFYASMNSFYYLFVKRKYITKVK